MLRMSRFWIGAQALLLCLGALGIYSAAKNGQTTDEAFFSASGYAMVRFNNYEFLGEQPPLANQIGAIPLAFLKLNFPISDPWLVPGTDRVDVARNGRRFLYQMGNDADRILFLQRIPIVILTLLLGLGIFFLSGELFGQWGALLSLALFAFDPNMIAHGSLYTTDMGLTAFYFFTIFALKRFFDLPSDGRVVWLGLACGAALMSKISSLILLPVLIGLFLIYYFSFANRTLTATPSRPLEDWILGISLFLLGNAIGEKQAMVLFGPFCLFAFYLCARDIDKIKKSKQFGIVLKALVLGGAVLCLIYSIRLKKKYGISVSTFLTVGSMVALGTAVLLSRFSEKDTRIRLLKFFLASWVIAFLVIVFGYTDFVYKIHRFIGFGNYMKPLGIVLSHSAGGHGACVEGSFITCDWKYFPGVMAVKTPLLTLALVVIGFFTLIFSRRSFLVKSLILLPVFCFLGAAMKSKINIGLRHILPVYPFLFVLGGIPGALLANLKNGSVKKTLVGILSVCLVLFAGRTLLTGPDYLAYFNESVGGPSQGAKLVADSNLNWGQDNKRLAEFVRDKHIPNIRILSEMMNADVYDYYKIPWQMAASEDLTNPAPGYYALGIGIYTAQQSVPGSWFYGKQPAYRVGKTFYIFQVPEKGKA